MLLSDQLTGVFWAAFTLFACTTASIFSGAVIERIRISSFVFPFQSWFSESLIYLLYHLVVNICWFALVNMSLKYEMMTRLLPNQSLFDSWRYMGNFKIKNAF